MLPTQTQIMFQQHHQQQGPPIVCPFQFTLHQHQLSYCNVVEGMATQYLEEYCSCISFLKSLQVMYIDTCFLYPSTQYIVMMHKHSNMPPMRYNQRYLCHHPQGWQPYQKVYLLDSDVDPLFLYHKILLFWVPIDHNMG